MTSLARRSIVLATAVLVCAGLPAMSSAAPGGGGGEAVITGSFDDDCLAFEAHSSNAIAYVDVGYADGTVVRTDEIGSRDYSVSGTKQIAQTQVKSRKSVAVFPCEPVPRPQCSDGADNDGDLLTDFPDDRGCTDATDENEVDEATGVAFRSRWRAPGGAEVARTHSASFDAATNLNVDDDPEPDLVGTISQVGPGAFRLDVDRAIGETSALPLALEAMVGSPAVADPTAAFGREHLTFGFDTLATQMPHGVMLTTVVAPVTPSSAAIEFDLAQEAPAGEISLTSALFNGTVEAPSDPVTTSMRYGASPGSAAVAIALSGNTSSLSVDGELRPGGVDIESSKHLDFVRLVSNGPQIREGADALAVEVDELPGHLSIELPETGSHARVESTTADGLPSAAGQVRLAASAAPAELPPAVADAQYNANPTNAAFRDSFTIDSTGSFAASMRLTAVETAEIDMDPFTVTLDQGAFRTRPLALSGTLPNSSAGLPTTIVSGLINKPSARTVIETQFRAGLPIRLRFENASPVASISLNATHLGSTPQASITVSNVPTRLTGCLDTSSTCRQTTVFPTALPDYQAFGGNPAQSGTAGGANRPYPSFVSLLFDDLGTSGTSSALSSMVTLNATVRLVEGVAPIQITNARFHTLALDMGVHPTSPTFAFLGNEFPRIQVYVDSRNLPFVLNDLAYPERLARVRIGTDGSPAIANRRLGWLPGTRCIAEQFGTCVSTALDQRTSGTLSCGGQRSFVIRQGGVEYDLLNTHDLQIVPICS